MEFFIDDLEESPKYDVHNPPEHTQLIFRGYNGLFSTEGRIEQKKGFRLLKKRSCKGCPTCDYIFDEELPQWCSDGGDLNEIENGKLYELILTNVPPSWTDCGYEHNAPELSFILIKETK